MAGTAIYMLEGCTQYKESLPCPIISNMESTACAEGVRKRGPYYEQTYTLKSQVRLKLYRVGCQVWARMLQSCDGGISE